MTRPFLKNSAFIVASALLAASCGGGGDSADDASQTTDASEAAVSEASDSGPRSGAAASATADKAAKDNTPAYAAPPSDPFYGASPAVIAEKVAPKFGGERIGNTPDVILAALEAGPVDDVDVDVRGVRLGMTLEEAEAALMENMPEGSIFEVTQLGTVQHIIGEAPTDRLTPQTPGAYPVTARASDPQVTKEVVSLDFALPPAKSVVRSITRSHRMQFATNFSETQTSVEVYRQALIDKYGPPDAEIPQGANGALLKWLYSDEVDCTSARGNGAAHGYNWVYQYAGDPADCSTALLYSYQAGADGIVTDASAKIGNVGLIQLNTLANRALMEALTEQVNAAKREAATDEPDL